MLYWVQFDRIENTAQYFVVIGELIETNERYPNMTPSVYIVV
jgi:hypothetical protein